MGKYRKKPVVIEAMHFTRENMYEIVEWTGKILCDITIPKCINGVMTGKIETLEGVMIAMENDYIIKGINGEFYPCKPDIFEMTYELVSE